MIKYLYFIKFSENIPCPLCLISLCVSMPILKYWNILELLTKQDFSFSSIFPTMYSRRIQNINCIKKAWLILYYCFQFIHLGILYFHFIKGHHCRFSCCKLCCTYIMWEILKIRTYCIHINASYSSYFFSVPYMQDLSKMEFSCQFW